MKFLKGFRQARVLLHRVLIKITELHTANNKYLVAFSGTWINLLTLWSSEPRTVVSQRSLCWLLMTLCPVCPHQGSFAMCYSMRAGCFSIPDWRLTKQGGSHCKSPLRDWNAEAGCSSNAHRHFSSKSGHLPPNPARATSQSRSGRTLGFENQAAGVTVRVQHSLQN